MAYGFRYLQNIYVYIIDIIYIYVLWITYTWPMWDINTHVNTTVCKSCFKETLPETNIIFATRALLRTCSSVRAMWVSERVVICWKSDMLHSYHPYDVTCLHIVSDQPSLRLSHLKKFAHGSGRYVYCPERIPGHGRVRCFSLSWGSMPRSDARNCLLVFGVWNDCYDCILDLCFPSMRGRSIWRSIRRSPFEFPIVQALCYTQRKKKTTNMKPENGIPWKRRNL